MDTGNRSVLEWVAIIAAGAIIAQLAISAMALVLGAVFEPNVWDEGTAESWLGR
jgi:hypothetical protein